MSDFPKVWKRIFCLRLFYLKLSTNLYGEFRLRNWEGKRWKRECEKLLVYKIMFKQFL